MERGCVLLLTYGGKQHSVALNPARKYTIGRGSGANIRVPDEKLSRCHISIVHGSRTASWYAKDLGSRNGTHLYNPDSRRLEKWDEGVLARGQVLRIGDVTLSIRKKQPAPRPTSRKQR